MSRVQLRNQLNQKLSKIKARELQSWLNEVFTEIPELQSEVEGIFCGREGRIHEEIFQHPGLFLTMGWYTVATTPKVEYAYVS